MSNSQRLLIIQKYDDIVSSLNSAVRLAGGSPNYDHRLLSDITASELLAELCTNNIEFVYTGPRAQTLAVQGPEDCGFV